jgi:hypothetical protein
MGAGPGTDSSNPWTAIPRGESTMSPFWGLVTEDEGWLGRLVWMRGALRACLALMVLRGMVRGMTSLRNSRLSMWDTAEAVEVISLGLGEEGGARGDG